MNKAKGAQKEEIQILPGAKTALKRVGIDVDSLGSTTTANAPPRKFNSQAEVDKAYPGKGYQLGKGGGLYDAKGQPVKQ